MNTIKKLIFILGLIAAGLVSAQNLGMDNMLKIGLNGGVSVPSENATANLGLDVSYQHLVTPSFGLGIATGYNQFFGKNTTINSISVENNDFGVVPVAALVRFYPKKTGFYAGADLGYGFIVGDDKVTNDTVYNADMPNGGFYLRPEIGYHNTNWNFFVHYTKVFTGSKGEYAGQKFNAGTLGLGFGYNIALGNGKSEK